MSSTGSLLAHAPCALTESSPAMFPYLSLRYKRERNRSTCRAATNKPLLIEIQFENGKRKISRFSRPRAALSLCCERSSTALSSTARTARDRVQRLLLSNRGGVQQRDSRGTSVAYKSSVAYNRGTCRVQRSERPRERTWAIKASVTRISLIPRQSTISCKHVGQRRHLAS